MQQRKADMTQEKYKNTCSRKICKRNTGSRKGRLDIFPQQDKIHFAVYSQALPCFSEIKQNRLLAKYLPQSKQSDSDVDSISRTQYAQYCS